MNVPIFDNSIALSNWDTPCRECDHRHFKCHSECKNYLTFQAAWQAEKERKLHRQLSTYNCKIAKKKI